MSERQSDDGEWKCVDARPFECPNGHGLLKVESSTSVYCTQCGYVREVMQWDDGSEEPTVYVYGKPVHVRGIERRWDDGMELGYEMIAHIDFINEQQASTTEVPLNQLKIDGGLSALNDYLRERDMVPQWWVNGKVEPPSE